MSLGSRYGAWLDEHAERNFGRAAWRLVWSVTLVWAVTTAIMFALVYALGLV